MGHITKKIIGDVEKDPEYNNLIIEDNASGWVHMHLKNLRMDMDHKSYNEFVRAMKISYKKIKAKLNEKSNKDSSP